MRLRILPALVVCSFALSGCAPAFDADAERTRVAATIYAGQSSGAPTAAGRTPTSSSSPTPAITPTITPVPSGFRVPWPEEAITLSNVVRVEGLARWGGGAVDQISISPQSGYIAIAASLGLDVYRGPQADHLYSVSTDQAVSGVAVSEETDTLAFAVGDRIMIARLSTGEPLSELFHGSDEGATRLRFSPDGAYLAIWSDSLSYDGSVTVIQSQDWEYVHQFNLDEAYVAGVDFSPQSDFLVAAGGFQDGVYVWELATGELVHKVSEWTVEDIDGVFSPSGPAFIEHFLGDYTLIDLSLDVPIAALPDPPLIAFDRVFSPDGRYLYFGGESWEGDGGLVLAWDTEDGNHREYPVRDWLSSLAISPDGKTLAGATRDGTFQLWQAEGVELRHLAEFTQPRAQRVALTGDGLMIGVTSNHVVQAWNVADRQLVSTIGQAGLSSPLTDVAISHNGTYVAAGAHDGYIAVWKAVDGQPILTMEHSAGTYSGMQVGFARDEGTLVAVDNVSFGRWTLPDGGARKPFLLANDATNYSGPQYSGSLLETSEDLILLLNSTEYDEVSCGTLPSFGTLSVRNDLLSVRLAGDFTVLSEYQCLTVDAGNVLMSPDRSLLYTRSVPSGDQPCQADSYVLFNHPEFSFCLGLPTPTPQAGEPRTQITKWNWGDGMPLGSYAVDGIAAGLWQISPDGSLLVLVTDKGLDLLEAGTGALLQRISLEDLPECADPMALPCLYSLQALTFSPDSGLLAAGVGGDILLWDIRTGQTLKTLTGHLRAVTALDFSDDGRLLASASEDGTVRLWGIRPEGGNQ